MTNNKILIVEDEFIVALNVRQILSDLDFDVIGIAPDSAAAYRLAQGGVDFALVDLNLRDGHTGPEIGGRLSEVYGATVLFLTANAAQLGDGVKGTVGVMSKPVDENVIESAVAFLVKRRSGQFASPPSAVRLFPNAQNDNTTFH